MRFRIAAQQVLWKCQLPQGQSSRRMWASQTLSCLRCCIRSAPAGCRIPSATQRGMHRMTACRRALSAVLSALQQWSHTWAQQVGWAAPVA